MPKHVKCPKCGDSFTTQGIRGHLRFTHELEGDELDNAHEEARDASSASGGGGDSDGGDSLGDGGSEATEREPESGSEGGSTSLLEWLREPVIEWEFGASS